MLPATTRSLPISLLRAREAVMRNFRPMLLRHDITEQQWRVLRALDEQSPLDASEVAERAMILAPSLTRIIRALQKRKLILRGRLRSDGRRVQLSIAPSGQSLIAAVATERRAIYNDIERRYGRQNTARLIDMLDRLIERLD